ncbi:MAG: acetate kinase, partial [Burkholderiales bacterium]
VEHKIAKGRWVIAHLGSGSSLCGIKNGKSVVTSMGFSVLEGVPMASRCGDLDPAIPMYLANKYKLAPDEISDVLYHKSGLLGLSNNISNDMAVLVSSKEPVAKFAVEFFCLQVALYITKFATALGGIDGIVFTGGVGENSAPVRSLIIGWLGWLNISISKKANNAHKLKIHKKDCLVKILVVPTNEELAMVDQFLERNK